MRNKVQHFTDQLINEKMVLNGWDFRYFDNLIKNGLSHAVFDLENTIVESNITEFYMYIVKQKLPIHKYILWKSILLTIYGPFYLFLDWYDREIFQRKFYKRYENFTASEVYLHADRFFKEYLKGRFIQIIHDLVFYFIKKEVEVIILSTAMEPIVKSFGEYFHVSYFCLELMEREKQCKLNLSELKNFKYNFSEL